MKNYKIVLNALGGITQIPDSQKLFGALITQYARYNGNERASELVRKIHCKSVHLSLSSLLPLNYFPMPQDYVIDRLAEQNIGEKKLKEIRKEIKKRVYINKKNIQSVLDQPGKAEEVMSYIQLCSGQQLRASIDSVVYRMEGLENQLYTVPVTELQKIEDAKIIESVSEFCFYLQGDSHEEITDILNMMEEMKKDEERIILGKRASQGLNLYCIKSIESVELPKGNAFLNLGMLLPDQINFSESTIKLFTSERRPFEIEGGWTQSREKQFISFIDIGSVIVLNAGIEAAGRCVLSPFNKNRDIVFGNAFLYPINL